jgi:hypothetical protein
LLFPLRSRRQWLLCLLLVTAVAVAAHPLWLRWLGHLLVKSEPPVKAELVVVLAGDWTGGRILKGGELVKQEYL